MENFSQNNTESREARVEQLKDKLRPYFHGPIEEAVSDDEINNFLDNIDKNEELKSMAEKSEYATASIFNDLCRKVYSDDELKSFVYSFKMRDAEVVKNQEELLSRIKQNPIATDEEYKAGAFKEQLETQVRDAVFVLQSKGYRTIQSGFDDLVSGDQSIHLSDDGLDIESIKKSMPYDKVSVFRSGDRVIIGFKPQIGYKLDVMKKIWDNIANSICVNSNITDKEFSDNGLQGVDFRERQDKIKNNQNTWLAPGLAFIDGQVVEISYDDFKRMYPSDI